MTLRQLARRVYDELRPNGIVSLFRLRVIGPNKSHGVRYQTVDPEMFRACLSAIPEDLSQFTFIDLGCGKGRALLLAREFGFRKIMGVEFAPALAKIARQSAPFAALSRAMPENSNSPLIRWLCSFTIPSIRSFLAEWSIISPLATLPT